MAQMVGRLMVQPSTSTTNLTARPNTIMVGLGTRLVHTNEVVS